MSNVVISQEMKPATKNKSIHAKRGKVWYRLIHKTPWTIGVSGHVVDDNGKPFKKLFDTKLAWNFLSFPARITLDGYYKNGFSFQGEFAYNKFKPGKEINGEIIKGSWTFFSADVNMKYDLNEVIGKTNWFDPYVAGGYGYTLRSGAFKPSSVSFNMGLGFNVWIFENLGFNAQSIAKFAMIQHTSNYLHHSVGVVYKLSGGQGSRPGRLGKRYAFLRSKF